MRISIPIWRGGGGLLFRGSTGQFLLRQPCPFLGARDLDRGEVAHGRETPIVMEDEMMLGLMRGPGTNRPQRRGSPAVKAAVGCEALEGRQLLSRGFGGGVGLGAGSLGLGRSWGSRMAEMGSLGGG